MYMVAHQHICVKIASVLYECIFQEIQIETVIVVHEEAWGAIVPTLDDVTRNPRQAVTWLPFHCGFLPLLPHVLNVLYLHN